MNVLGFISLLLALPCVAPAQTVWKAGVAQAVITPGESIWLAGYGDRTRPSEGVLRDIYVKALALDAEAGKPVVIVTADLVGIPARDFRSGGGAMRKRVRASAGPPGTECLAHAQRAGDGSQRLASRAGREAMAGG